MPYKCPEKARANKRKYYLENKERLDKASSARYRYYKENHLDKLRDYKRKSHLKRTYGLSPDDYNDLLKKQNYACAICELPNKELDDRTLMNRNLHVDHCHETGENRGLLCSNCNKSLGNFQDSIEVMEKAIQYLKKWK